MVNIETKFEDINMILNKIIQELNSDYMLLKHYEQLIEMFRAALYYNEIEEETRREMMANAPDIDDERYDLFIKNVDEMVKVALDTNLSPEEQELLEDRDINNNYYFGDNNDRYDESKVLYQLAKAEKMRGFYSSNISKIYEQLKDFIEG